MNRRSLASVVLVVASLLLVACGEGSGRQIASNSKADRQTPAANAPGATGKAGGSKPAAVTTTSAPPAARIAVQDDVFEPAEVEVTKGEAVAWTWAGKNPHNVTGSGFKSKIQTSGTFTRTFGEAGTFDYRCEVHPTMQGAVVVTG